jgi:RNA polymerase sigma factor (sigma-70 family)
LSTQLHYINAETSLEDRIVYLLTDQDKGALRLIHENYSVVLFNVILRIVKHEDIAKDVLQDALIKIWKKSFKFERKKGGLYTWMVAICRNAAIDKTRSRDFMDRQKSNEALDIVFVSDSLGRESKGDNDDFHELLQELTEHHRHLINLSFFEGYTHPEISAQLNMPLGTVKTRIRMALIHLRSII